MGKRQKGIKFSITSNAIAPYVFLSPTLLLFIFIFIFPILFVLWSSMFNWNLLNPSAGMKFIGLQNFTDLISDSEFIDSIIVTVKFVVITVPLGLALGLGLALLFNRPFAGKKLIQGILLLPMMAAPVAVFLSWKFLLEPTYGIVNYVLSLIHIKGPGWFSDAHTALISVIIVDLWFSIPFVFLVLYAALQSVPSDPYEAALVDGANRLQTFWYITFPSIKPVFLVITIVRIMDAIRAFENIYVLTRGGPASATRTIQFECYDTSFYSFMIGKGSAIAIIIVLIILLVGSLLIREMNKTNDELKQ